MVKVKIPKISSRYTTILKKRWYVIPIGIIILLFAGNFAKFTLDELSIVKIPTEYGTLEITESAGITLSDSIIQTVRTTEDGTFTISALSSSATITELSGFTPLLSTDTPIGVVSGHEIFIKFDGDASTEEALFFTVIVDIDGVEWHQATVYSGTGAQLKVFQPPPQETTGEFFIFFHQTEILRNLPSYMFQFKGYKASTSENVFVTTYYSVVYSYVYDTVPITASETTTTEDYNPNDINPYFSSFINLTIILPILIGLAIIKRKKRKSVNNG